MSPLVAARKHPEAVMALLGAAAVAWWWTVNRMAGMSPTPGTDLGTVGWFTGTWALMMTAMMLPSFVPTLGAYATVSRGRDRGSWFLFAGGYLLVWTVAGLLAYAVLELGRELLGGGMAWQHGGRWLCGGVLVAAAAYELVPFKGTCLTRCRGQLGEVRRGSRSNSSAALGMGARSGAWCIGCSWALMAALFALGAMSLTWMALVAVLVGLEKAGPWPLVARLATASVLIALAVGILIAPHEVPGFVAPGSQAMHAMSTTR